jgi:hypothetical protein
VLGPFAIYADNPFHARQAYEHLCADSGRSQPFGTVTLDTGEEVDWINIRYGVVSPRLVERTCQAPDQEKK